MSKTQDKKLKTKVEHAEFLWNDAQMRAALLQQTLQFAIEEFESHKNELEADVVSKIEEQIAIRQKDIKTFLMGEKDKYLERMGIQQD